MRGMEMEKKMVELVENRVSEILDEFSVKHGEKMMQLTDAIVAINLQNQQFKTLWVKGESLL